MVGNYRARSEEQKAERRALIIDAAQKLFIKSNFHSINMNQIAEMTGVAKGTLFLYFKTKEHLFLELAREVIHNWDVRLKKLLTELISSKSLANPDDLINLFKKSSLDERQLIRLFAILGPILERNIDYDTAKEFKLFLKELVVSNGKLLEEYITNLNPGDGEKFFLYTYMLITGIQNVSEPSKTVSEVIKKEDNLKILDIQFSPVFFELLTILIKGMLFPSKEYKISTNDSWLLNQQKKGYK